MIKNRLFRILMLLPILVVLLTAEGCIKTMGDTEYGILVKRLPKSWGGGIKKVINPGEMVLYSPFWTSLYTVDTRLKSITWAEKGKGDRPSINDALPTRAMDGNEVWLGVTEQYRPLSEQLNEVIRNFTDNGAYLTMITEAYSRGFVRTYMGELFTKDFYDSKARYDKADKTQRKLNAVLSPQGIEMVKVILDTHKFADEYQNKINDAKKTEQEAQKEFNRIETVKTQKKKELQDAIGDVNKMIEDAKGEARKAKDRGDAYYKAKHFEAKAIIKTGETEVEGIKRQIAALNRPGGKNLVRIKIGKALLARHAPFILLNKEGGKAGDLDFSKVDYNLLLNQLGIQSLAGESPEKEEGQSGLDALKEKVKENE